MEIKIFQSSIDDATEILAFQKIAYQKELILYEDWDIPPLTQTIPEIQAEFEKVFSVKRFGGTKLLVL